MNLMILCDCSHNLNRCILLMLHCSPTGGGVVLSPSSQTDEHKMPLSTTCSLLSLEEAKERWNICSNLFVLLSLFSQFLFPPPPHPHLSSNPLLFCYVFSSSYYPHYSLIPHCPSLCSSHLVSILSPALRMFAFSYSTTEVCCVCGTEIAGRLWVLLSMDCCFRLEGSTSASVTENQAGLYNDNSCRPANQVAMTSRSIHLQFKNACCVPFHWNKSINHSSNQFHQVCLLSFWRLGREAKGDLKGFVCQVRWQVRIINIFKY